MNRSLLLLLVWIFSTPLYSQTKTYETLTWQDIESQIYRHETVQQALIAKNVKAAQYATEAGWKGLKIHVNPSLQYSDPEGTLAYTQSALGAELSFPLGITQEEKEKKIQAFEPLDLSDKELRTSYGQAYLELFSLFMSAFLEQESVTVAEAELELFRLKASVTRQKVSQGLAPVSDQTDAEFEFQAAAEKLIQTRLDLRLVWLNLAYAANLPISRMGIMGGQSNAGDPVGSVPRFEGLDVSAFLKEVPQPGRLMAVAKSNSPSILAQQQKLEKAKRAITYQATTNFDFLPKFT